MFSTWFQRLPFWSENCISLLKRQFLSSLCIIVSLYKQVHIINRTFHGGEEIWILCSRGNNDIENIKSIFPRHREISYISFVRFSYGHGLCCGRHTCLLNRKEPVSNFSDTSTEGLEKKGLFQC